ncbi:Mut7-C RNAse domain-containing protein [candidate division KSB1 bacterium]
MIKLIADSMLGGLVRWLRLLGLDVEYDPTLTTPRILNKARRDGRVIVTRSFRKVMDLPEDEYLCIFHDDPRRQILEVTSGLALQLDTALYFTRCLLDNAQLVPEDKENLKNKVPPYVYANQTLFARCPACDRIYWPGTHYSRMLAIIEELGLPVKEG